MSKKSPNPPFVYKTKTFARFARKARITDADLWETALRVNAGAVDADLGGGVIKQRIARAGEGKSGGSRCIILFRVNDRAVYVFGFEKKDMENVSSKEVAAYKEFAAIYLSYTLLEMQRLVEKGVLQEVTAPKESDNA